MTMSGTLAGVRVRLGAFVAWGLSSLTLALIGCAHGPTPLPTAARNRPWSERPIYFALVDRFAPC